MSKAKSAALSALAKIRSERDALAKREAELIDKAAHELGLLVLGTGAENFSPSAFKKILSALGSLGENEALSRLTPVGK